MADQIHMLRIRAEHKPRVATEGEEFIVNYFAKNIGAKSFPGGTITVRVSWPSLGQNVIDTDVLEIDKPIAPNVELFCGSRKYTPMTSGYSLFNIIHATAYDQSPVSVYDSSGERCLPPEGGERGIPVVYSVRAQTHEEISQRKAIWIAVGSLIVIAIFQVIDWALRFFYKV